LEAVLLLLFACGFAEESVGRVEPAVLVVLVVVAGERDLCLSASRLSISASR
jgi:hypothetical protein